MQMSMKTKSYRDLNFHLYMGPSAPFMSTISDDVKEAPRIPPQRNLFAQRESTHPSRAKKTFELFSLRGQIVSRGGGSAVL